MSQSTAGKPPLKYIITTSELAEFVGEPEPEVKGALPQDALFGLPNRKTGVSPDAVKEYLKNKGIDYAPRIIAHANLKGGIGKTTMTITAAARAAQYGFLTCIIDLDPQASASLAFGKIPEDDEPVFCDIWQDPAGRVMGALKVIQDNLYILPSSLDNSLLDLNLVNPRQQKNAVKDVCNVLQENHFDLIVIDCPPNLGTSVISSICAVDTIVIPVCNDVFSFKGLELTINEVSSICETFNLKPPVIKVLYTNFDKRIRASNDILSRLSSRYMEYLVPAIIRTSTEFSKSIARQETIFASSQKSPVREDCDLYVRYLLGMTDVLKMRHPVE